MADETNVRWQHGETGRVCELPPGLAPGGGWARVDSDATVGSIVVQYLKRHGYDGLIDGDGCGCSLDDLAPCGSMGEGCMPAYHHPRPGSSCWMMPMPHVAEGCAACAKGDDDE